MSRNLEPATGDEEIEHLVAALVASTLEPAAEPPPAPAALEQPSASEGGQPNVEPAAASPAARASQESERPWVPRVVSRDEALGYPARLDGAELRCYAVWSFCHQEGGTAWAGVHCGRGKAAYAGILSLNGGSIGGLRWTRKADVRATEQEWIARAGKHAVPRDQLRFYLWEDTPPSARKAPSSAKCP